MEKTKPQITSSEVEQWENKFRNEVSTQVQFTSGENDGSSFRLYNGISGVEAEWAGTILFNADNFIKFTFSIQNGLFIETKVVLNQDVHELMTRLYNFYNTWKEEWSKQLSIPDANRDDTQNVANGTPEPASNEAPTPDAIQEDDRTKLGIITHHKGRMQILAGLR